MDQEDVLLFDYLFAREQPKFVNLLWMQFYNDIYVPSIGLVYMLLLCFL